MKIKGQYRQGDVLIERIGDAPRAFKPAKETPTLAEGEVSGHSHRVYGGAVLFRDDALARDLGENAYIGTLDVKAGGALRHVLPDGSDTGEHDKIPLNGRHLVGSQREYDPEGDRRAQD